MNKIVPLVCVIALLWLQGCVSAGSRRQNYVASHPELGRDISTAILEGRIIKGMNTEDVRAAWGEPDQTTASASGQDLTKTWSYNTPVGRFTEGVVILTFSDDRLISLVH